MAITYPKVYKPARTVPLNVQHCLRLKVQQANPNPVNGEVALVRDKALYIGTVPAGSFICPPISQVKTAFTAAVTLDIGTDVSGTKTIGNILATADIAPQTAAGQKATATGAGLGPVTAETRIFIAAQAAVPAAGALDVVIPFYVQAD